MFVHRRVSKFENGQKRRSFIAFWPPDTTCPHVKCSSHFFVTLNEFRTLSVVIYDMDRNYAGINFYFTDLLKSLRCRSLVFCHSVQRVKINLKKGVRLFTNVLLNLKIVRSVGYLFVGITRTLVVGASGEFAIWNLHGTNARVSFGVT